VLSGITVFVAFYTTYLTICIFCLRRRAPHPTRTEEYSTVSIIIPTYNEANVIQRKIENLETLHYPKGKLDIIFVDGGSTDETVELLEKHAKQRKLPLKIVEQGSRKGFNNAVIDGFAASSGDIICVTGAETEYDRDALKLMIDHFVDPKIGAVTGRVEMKNPRKEYSPRLEGAYRNLYDLVRAAESRIDSVFDIKGEVSAARRSVMLNLTQKPELQYKGAIDTCISFEARMQGYKAIYEPNAVYFELAPSSLRDSLKQQKRRAAALIENLVAFRNMILRRKFGAFGMLIMPAHFLMLVVLPLLLLTSLIGLIVLVILDPTNVLPLTIILLSLSVSFVFVSVQAFLKTQLALITALFGMLFGIETQKFERISSTRTL